MSGANNTAGNKDFRNSGRATTSATRLEVCNPNRFGWQTAVVNNGLYAAWKKFLMNYYLKGCSRFLLGIGWMM